MFDIKKKNIEFYQLDVWYTEVDHWILSIRCLIYRSTMGHMSLEEYEGIASMFIW